MFGPDLTKKSLRSPLASKRITLSRISSEENQPVEPCNIMYDRRVVRGNTWAVSRLTATAADEQATPKAARPKSSPGSRTWRAPGSKALSEKQVTQSPVDGRHDADVQTENVLELLTPPHSPRGPEPGPVPSSNETEPSLSLAAKVQTVERLRLEVEELRLQKEALAAEKAAKEAALVELTELRTEEEARLTMLCILEAQHKSKLSKSNSSIEDDSASGASDEDSADTDSQPRSELPEEFAAELKAAAEADKLPVEAEEQEEIEELQVAPLGAELLAEQQSERLSEGSLAEEPGLQPSMEAPEELQAVRVEEEGGSAAVGEELAATAEEEGPSAEQGLEELQIEAEELMGLEGGSEVGSADAAVDEVEADAAEEDEVHAPTEVELQNGIELPQLQPDTDQTEAVSELAALDEADNPEAAGSEAGTAGEAEELTGAADDSVSAAAEQGSGVEDAQSDSAEGETVLELIEADKSSTASDPGQLLETVSADALLPSDAGAEDVIQAELDADASADATIAQQPEVVVIGDTLLDAAESSEAAEQLLGAAAVDQVRTMLSDPSVVRSLSSEQYEVIASFEEDLQTPEEGITEQLQAAEFAALSLAQKTAEKMTGGESEANEAAHGALNIAAGASGNGAEALQRKMPSRADSAEAELVEATEAEGKIIADIAKSHSSSVVEESEAVDLEAAAAEEAAEGALEDLEGIRTVDDEQAAVAPAMQELADEEPADLHISAEGAAGSQLRVEIENPAGEVVAAIFDRINQDDWMPGMSGQDPSDKVWEDVIVKHPEAVDAPKPDTATEPMTMREAEESSAEFDILVDGSKGVLEAELQQLDQPTTAADAATDAEDSLELEPSAPPVGTALQPEPEPVHDLGTHLNGAALHVARQTPEPSTSGGQATGAALSAKLDGFAAQRSAFHAPPTYASSAVVAPATLPNLEAANKSAAQDIVASTELRLTADVQQETPAAQGSRGADIVGHPGDHSQLDTKRHAGHKREEREPTAVLESPRGTATLLARESSPPQSADRFKQATLNAALAEKLESFQAQIAALHEQADNTEESLTVHRESHAEPLADADNLETDPEGASQEDAVKAHDKARIPALDLAAVAHGADRSRGSGAPTSERVEREGKAHLRADMLAGGLKLLTPASGNETGNNLESPDPEEALPQVGSVIWAGQDYAAQPAADTEDEGTEGDIEADADGSALSGAAAEAEGETAAQNDTAIQDTDADLGLKEAGHSEALKSPGIKTAASESAVKAAPGRDDASALIAAKEPDLAEAASLKLDEGLIPTSVETAAQEASNPEIAETHAQEAADLNLKADKDAAHHGNAAQQGGAAKPGSRGAQEEGERSQEELVAVQESEAADEEDLADSEAVREGPQGEDSSPKEDAAEQESLAAVASVIDSAAVREAAELLAAVLEVEEDIKQEIDGQPADELGSTQKQVTFQLGDSELEASAEGNAALGSE